MGKQRLSVGSVPEIAGKIAIAVLEDLRKRPLREIAEAVGQFGIATRDNGFGRIAAVLPEGDFAQQEIAQGIDPEAVGQFVPDR
jgi:hypothetical protein